MPVMTKRAAARNTILNHIKSGKFKPGQKLKGDRELCGELSVSRMTLSKALNELVRHGVLERRVGSGTFVSENLDHLIPLGTRLTIALVASSGLNPMTQGILRGMQELLPPDRCDIIIKDPRGDVNMEKAVIENLLGDKVDGLVVSTGFPGNSLEGARFYEQIARRAPLVMTDCVPFWANVPMVLCDNRAGGAMAAASLMERVAPETRLFVLTTGRPLATTEWRVEGFLNYVAANAKEASVEVRRFPIVPDGDVFAWCDELFAEVDVVSCGIFMCKDILPAFMRTAERSGIALREMRICTFDNFSGMAEMFGAPYIRQPLEAIGREIANCLVNTKNLMKKPYRKILMAPELVA